MLRANAPRWRHSPLQWTCRDRREIAAVKRQRPRPRRRPVAVAATLFSQQVAPRALLGRVRVVLLQARVKVKDELRPLDPQVRQLVDECEFEAVDATGIRVDASHRHVVRRLGGVHLRTGCIVGYDRGHGASWDTTEDGVHCGTRPRTGGIVGYTCQQVAGF